MRGNFFLHCFSNIQKAKQRRNLTLLNYFWRLSIHYSVILSYLALTYVKNKKPISDQDNNFYLHQKMYF